VTADGLVADFGCYAGTFLVAVISSLVPLVSIDLFLIGLTLATGTGAAIPIVLLAAAGQVVGKLPVYFAARGVTAVPGRQRARIERVRAWVARWQRSRHLVLGTSAVLGLPPFSIISTAAGALAIELRTFCVIVFGGRALRFACVIAATGLAGTAHT
jgi:membrane protein YqaA with SNARE-associated domain